MKIDVSAVMRGIYGKGRSFLVDGLGVPQETWRVIRVFSTIFLTVAFLLYAAASSFGQGPTLIGGMGTVSILGIIGSGIVYCLPTKKLDIRRGLQAVAVCMICIAISLLLGLIAGYLVF